MKTFIVYVREVWIQPVRVKADSKEAARMKVAFGDGDPIESLLEYSHTPDDYHNWEVGEQTNEGDLP